MIKEKFSIKRKELALNIVQSEIQSVRKKDITKTAIRIYKDNKIGIMGKIGDFNEDELIKKAEENLNLEIDYPYEVTENVNKEENTSCDFEDDKIFHDEMESLLLQLKKDNPDFNFSNQIKLIEEETILENTKNTYLKSNSRYYEIMLIVKEKGSSNIMDMGFGFQAQKYNREEILKNAKKLCDAYKKPIESFEDGIYPVVFIQEDYLIKMKFFKDLNALIYGSGGSIFTEKIGEKLFSENFNLIQSKNIEDGYLGAFFDVEGTINKNYKYNLIENGVLKTPFTNKKYSKMFNLPLTGAASGSFDSTPDLGFTNLIIQDTGKSIKELLNGQKAIFVLISSGGDYTPDGKFGAPVQASFLFDGENYLGKLPELNLSSHLYDMYGKDFVGVSNDNLFSFARSNLAVMNMKVSKI